MFCLYPERNSIAAAVVDVGSEYQSGMHKANGAK